MLRILWGTLLRVTICRDARSCVHCIKGYSVVVFTGTDALSLDTIRASYKIVTRLDILQSTVSIFVSLWRPTKL